MTAATAATSTPRRTFLRVLGKGALASLMGVAVLFRAPGAAEANCCRCGLCCLLKKAPSSGCPSDCNLFPQYHIRTWSCCNSQHGRIYVCRECTTASNCFGASSSNTLCSYCYVTSTAC